MERLQELLKEHCHYIINEVNDNNWIRQYLDTPFPSYWQYVFNIADKLPREIKVLEIGAGYGLITSIFLYLGFHQIKSYEEVKAVAHLGNGLIDKLFRKKNIILPNKFNNQTFDADLLIIVNCSYSDGCNTKQEYMERLKKYYIQANKPKYYILEVIDSEYTKPDKNFPEHIRLSAQDIKNMFPCHNIDSWKTYEYPKNKKSKTLYLIQR